jgi:YD repeat-containing protein
LTKMTNSVRRVSCMPFSKLVPLSRLIGLITRNIHAKWIRAVFLVIFFAVVLSTLPVHQDATAQGSRPRRTQGPPSRNLPNLDETRGVEPGTPKIMQPVPATKCRGRDEKCKKAKGKISNNLTDNQDRLLAYTDYRSSRDFAGWLKVVIPALSMLDDLIYGSARMISDFPDIPYRSHGDLLTGSAVKGANPRNDTYGNAASRGLRNGYGYRSGRSPLTAQSGGIVTVNPSAYQTPAGGGSAVSSPSNTGHVLTTISFGGGAGGSKTCKWSGFASVSGQILSIRLKMDWSAWGSGASGGSGGFSIDYSLNGGSSWTSAVNISGANFSQTSSVDVLLPAGQNITQVQVRDSIGGGAGPGASYSGNASVSLIRLEVEVDNIAPVISNVAAGGITATSATITWNTNENSDSQVEYGTTTAYGQSTTLNPALVTAHSQGLSGLTSGTVYHYRVKSMDAAGNHAVSGDFTFSTPDITAPVISNVAAVGITATSATITWNTNENSDSQVEYGTTTAYGQSTALNPSLVNAHSQGLSGLTQGTLYHYRVKSRDAAGNLAVSGDFTFSTLSLNLNMALIDPTNRIGLPGKDLLSRNCNWSLPLLSLPGRAGMDLGLALSLNSLIYTRAGSVMHFDPDQSDLAPGFRLGFPEIRNAFTNTDAGAQSYLLSMPSGSRVEFRQTNTNVYESVDSSYMLLTHDPVNSVFILRTTDGTQFRFVDVTGQGDYKCVQIKDRHGNYITIGYGSFAEITTVTDTLGRLINFNYDGSNHLLSITQNWGGQTHTWATFAYGTQTIQTNFPGLTLNGTTNEDEESVLLRVGLTDGSVYSFEYNTYAQVKTIRRYAPNNSNPINFPGDYSERAYTTYGLPDNANDQQTDCPRATSRTDGADDWHSSVTSYYDGDSSHAWGQITFPDGTKYKVFFATTGWQRGLTTQTENWTSGVSGVRKKWTTLHWTQDNTGVSYKLNPRVTETNVYDDANNRRRTTVSYTSFGLPCDVYEYDADATTVLRRAHTDYNLSAVYTSRRIIGLPSAVYLYNGNNTLFSKVTYEYDLGGAFLAHQGPPIQHDTANYGSGFVQGRGDLNRTRRWDVTDQDNQSKASENEIGYNTSGSVIFTRDPFDHQANISYTDSFSDEQNDRNTYAYPTTITDPDEFSSAVQYNYDFGAVTRTQNPKDAVVTRTYDAAGRIERKTNVVNGAYTRFVYWPHQREVETYTTINDLNPANEFRSVTSFDGHDRVRATMTDHPTSVGQYKAQYNVYDVMGRLAQQSNPTEINSSGQLAGDDVVGWAWSYRAYDWQGRLTLSTDQEVKTNEILYGGCGCAGGQVVVTRDEVGRRQKMTYDILGRLKTTQVLFIQPKEQQLNGDGAVYLTTTNTYNVRDQITNINQRDVPADQEQNTVMDYDGHGRLKTRRLPKEMADTTYTYNADDTLHSVTDARGAGAAYVYNNSHLIKEINYTAAGGAAATNNVKFEYDSAGNRTWMYYGQNYLDWVHFDYDTQSRLNWEERRFNALGASYKISYEYNLVGQLKKITDPTDSTGNTYISYSFNNAGEMTGATGTPSFVGLTQYLSNLQYRAWGAIKNMNVGNSNQESISYTARMQAYEFNFRPQGADPSLPGLLKTRYDYFDDGMVKNVHALSNRSLDRAFTYDHVGRRKTTYSGWVAGLAPSDVEPYREEFGYDAFDHMISQIGKNWNTYLGYYATSYTNDKATTASTLTNETITENITYQHDNSGNITHETRTQSPGGQQTQTQYLYGAASRLVGQASSNPVSTVFYDADGQIVKDNSGYQIRSSVLGGQIVVKLNAAGQKQCFYVYANGQLLAEQKLDSQQQPSHIAWFIRDPHNTVEYDVFSGKDYLINTLGAQIYAPTATEAAQYWQGQFSPPSGYQPPVGFYSNPSNNSLLNMLTHGKACTIDGQPADCDKVQRGANKLYDVPGDRNKPNFGLPWMPIITARFEGDRERAYEFLFTQGLPEEQQQEDGGRNGRTDCGWFVDGLISEANRAISKALSRTTTYSPSEGISDPNVDAETGLGMTLAMRAIPQLHPENHDQGWTPTGWREIFVQAPQGGAAYSHVYGQAGGVVLNKAFAPYMRMGYWGLTGRGVADSQYQLDKDRLNTARNRLNAEAPGTQEFNDALRNLREREAEVAADEAGRDIGGWLREVMKGKMSPEDFKKNAFNRLCVR